MCIAPAKPQIFKVVFFLQFIDLSDEQNQNPDIQREQLPIQPLYLLRIRIAQTNFAQIRAEIKIFLQEMLFERRRVT